MPPAREYELSTELMAIIQRAGIKPIESEMELGARLDREKSAADHQQAIDLKETVHRHWLESGVLIGIGVIGIFCMGFMCTHSPQDELSRLVGTLLSTIATGTLGYIAGRRVGKP
jgi:hypothetical protein